MAQNLAHLIGNALPERRLQLDGPFTGANIQLAAGAWPVRWVGTASALYMAGFSPATHVPLMRRGVLKGRSELGRDFGNPTYWYNHVSQVALLLERIFLMDRQGYGEALARLIQIHQALERYDPVSKKESRAYFGNDDLEGLSLAGAFLDQLAWVIGCTVTNWTRTAYLLIGPEGIEDLDPDYLEADGGFAAFAEQVYMGVLEPGGSRRYRFGSVVGGGSHHERRYRAPVVVRRLASAG